MHVSVDVMTVWTSPAAPRAVDAPAVADLPRVLAWLGALDAHHEDDRRGDRAGQGRLGLHGRTLTQAVAGEPALVVAAPEAAPSDPPGWVRVVLPWQPSALDPRGYPGWARLAHLQPTPAASETPHGPHGIPPGVIELARAHVGLRYLWGGTSPLGLDCSGLVHLVWRALGAVVPRDADDQHRVAAPVPIGQEQPGDLYFFADANGAVDHVGIVTGPLRMLDAAEGRGTVAEGPLSPARLDRLYAVGRLPVPSFSVGPGMGDADPASLP